MYNDVFGRLQALKPGGMSFGTERTRALLDDLGSPDTKLKIIHVAGTNGKGSTAEFITRILIAAGKRTGTFTSPEIYSYFDQFRIDGKPIAEDALADSFGVAYSSAKKRGATAFETETAGVLLAFARLGCEYAVIECGLGGLNDATNAIKKKEVAVITSVSLEHTAYLGNTITEICAQKAGIIKDCPAVASCALPESAKQYLKGKGVIFTHAPENCDGDGFDYNGKRFALTAKGSAQPYNAACAIEAARILGIDEGAVYAGVKSAAPYGRIEVLNASGRRYVLDGAHNPAAFVPLRGILQDGKSVVDRTIVYGSLSDKDIDGNLRILADCADKIIAVKCPSFRAMDIEETAAACRKYFADVVTAESVSDALECARTDEVIVCGSFTLLKEAKQWIEKRQ